MSYGEDLTRMLRLRDEMNKTCHGRQALEEVTRKLSMKQMDLCFTCAAHLKEAVTVEQVKDSKLRPITCASCRKRRQGTAYLVGVKKEE